MKQNQDDNRNVQNCACKRSFSPDMSSVEEVALTPDEDDDYDNMVQ